MLRSVTRRDLYWAYIAQALNVGGGLVLLPILLRCLPTEDVGLWFVFISLASLAQLPELGFQPTLARNMAYVYSGARSLGARGVPQQVSPDGRLSIALLAALIATSRRIYRIVGCIGAVLLLVSGTAYISTVIVPAQDPAESIAAWVAYSGGYVVSLFFGYFNALLQGRGDVAQANKVVVIARGGQVLLGGGAVLAGYGLLGLGVASLVASVVGRWLARRYFFDSSRPEMEAVGAVDAAHYGDLTKTLWYNASRQGAVNLGAFLIQRGNILLASSFLGLGAAASYGMTVTILMALSGVSAVICQIQLPHISRMQAVNDMRSLQGLFGEIVILAWATYSAGLAVLIIGGQPFLDQLGSSTELLGTTALVLLGLIFLLELNHGISASYLTTTNQVPFLEAALVSGAATAILGFVLVQHWGIWGLIVVQGAVQVAYNNWKWPSQAAAHLGCSWREILVAGARRIAAHARH